MVLMNTQEMESKDSSARKRKSLDTEVSKQHKISVEKNGKVPDSEGGEPPAKKSKISVKKKRKNSKPKPVNSKSKTKHKADKSNNVPGKKKKKKENKEKSDGNKAMAKLHQLKLWKNLRWSCSEEKQDKKNYMISIVVDSKTYSGSSGTKTEAKYKAAVAALKGSGVKFKEEDSKGDKDKRPIDVAMGKLQALEKDVQWSKLEKSKVPEIIYTMTVALEDQSFIGTATSKTQARHLAAMELLKALKPVLAKGDEESKGSARIRRRSSNIGKMFRKLEQLQQLNGGKKLRWDCTESGFGKTLTTAAVTVADKTYDGSGNSETQARQRALVTALKDLDPTFKEAKPKKKAKVKDSSQKKMKSSDTGNEEEQKSKKKPFTPKSPKKTKSLAPMSGEEKTQKQKLKESPLKTPKQNVKETPLKNPKQKQKETLKQSPKEGSTKTKALKSKNSMPEEAEAEDKTQKKKKKIKEKEER